MSKQPRAAASGTRRVPQTAIDLPALDTLQGASVGLFCWDDVRPLSGVAGYVDWRLCGRLSHALVSNVFVGVLGDTLMVPVSGRFGPRRLFVFGLGHIEQWSTDLAKSACRQAVTVMRQAGATELVLVAPALRDDNREAEQTFLIAAGEEIPTEIQRVLVERV